MVKKNRQEIDIDNLYAFGEEMVILLNKFPKDTRIGLIKGLVGTMLTLTELEHKDMNSILIDVRKRLG